MDLSATLPASLRKQVEGFLDLHEGWNGYGAPAPNHAAVAGASSALAALQDMLPAPDRVAPSAVGGVGVTYRRGARKAYVECYNSGQIVLLLSDSQAEQLQTCKVDASAGGLANLPNVIKEFLDGGIA